MKKLLIGFLSMFVALSVFAQSKNDVDLATTSTEQLIQMYNLDDDQATKMQVIQERKYRNLGEIEAFRNENSSLYIQKLRAIQNGIDASVKNLLNEDQVAIFNQKRIENRMLSSENYQKMKTDGLSKEQMEQKIIELELEMLQNH